MSSTAINFPKDRSELDQSINTGDFSPGTPLLNDDTFVTAGTSYQWRQDSGETYGRWRNEDPGATGDGRYVKLEDAGTTQVINGGGILSINDNLYLNGTSGKITSAETVESDNDTILATKGYVDSQVSAPDLQSVTDVGNNTTNDITLGTGDLITLNATDGTATFAGGKTLVAASGAIVTSSRLDARPVNDTSAGVQVRNSSDISDIRFQVIGSGKVEMGSNLGTTTPTVQIFANNGSATFATGSVSIESTGIVQIDTGNAVSSGNAAVTYAGSNGARNLRVNGDGTVGIGGALQGGGGTIFEPNIKLSADGTGEFFKLVKVTRSGTGNSYVWLGYDAAAPGTATSWIKNDGDYYFAGTGSFRNAVFNLEPDNAANYTNTTDAEGNETSVYNGPSIDVKRTLQALATALATLSGASTSDYLLGPLTEAPTPSPEPEPTPDPTNLIPDDWTQDQRMAAMAELLQEYQANR